MNCDPRALALALAAVLACSAAAPAIEWRDAYTRHMDTGVEYYDGGAYRDALAAFQAALLERPNDPSAVFNRGLAKARLGDYESARTDFTDAADRAGEDSGLRARALYNRGLAEFSLAGKVAPEDRARALELALDSNRSFTRALDADPQFAEAMRNREHARELVQQLAQQPPEEEQQDQQQEQQDQGDRDEEDQEGQDEQQDQESGDDDQQQQQDPSSPGDEGEDQQEQQQQPGEDEGESGEQDGSQPQEGQDTGDGERDSQGSPGEAEQQPDGRLTPEDARRLLNLLGNPELLVPRLPDTSPRDPNRKEW